MKRSSLYVTNATIIENTKNNLVAPSSFSFRRCMWETLFDANFTTRSKLKTQHLVKYVKLSPRTNTKQLTFKNVFSIVQ